MSAQASDIKDRALAPQGALRIAWAAQEMPVLGLIGETFADSRPLQGTRISACLHVTAETANLLRALRAGGAEVVLCASNPLSTQDDVAAALVEEGIPVLAIKGEDPQTYYGHIEAALQHHPQVTMDDGADLVSTLHTRRQDLLSGVQGGTEETTTGVIRLRSMVREGQLRYPIIAVNDARTKYLFDNRYGTGQSTLDGILRATNLLLAGKTVVVAGFGWCGRGIALRARGMGAQVVVTEVDPLKALEAAMEGYQVMPMIEAAEQAHLLVTATGDIAVIGEEHFRVMRDGAIMCNAGHFNVEIDLPALEGLAASRRTVRPSVEEFRLDDGRRLYLLAEGRLVNLAAAEGHPAAVMDQSFALQALCVEHLIREGGRLPVEVHAVPEEIDQRVAQLKLEAMGLRIDRLTAEQERYLSSWEEGT